MKNLILFFCFLALAGCAQFWPRGYDGIAHAEISFDDAGNIATVEVTDGKEREDLRITLINADGARIEVNAEDVQAPNREGLIQLLLGLGFNPTEELLDEIINLARGEK